MNGVMRLGAAKCCWRRRRGGDGSVADLMVDVDGWVGDVDRIFGSSCAWTVVPLTTSTYTLASKPVSRSRRTTQSSTERPPGPSFCCQKGKSQRQPKHCKIAIDKGGAEVQELTSNSLALQLATMGMRALDAIIGVIVI